MTGLDHEHSAAIDEAAHFLAVTPIDKRLRPTVPLLRERFGLSAADAITAIREAQKIKGGAHAGGS